MRCTYKSHIGEVHNNLTILDYQKKGKGYFVCRCICGNIKEIRCDHILSNKIKSCGCELLKEHHEDLTGKRFGKLRVIEEAERRNKCITWKCICDCGNILNVSSSNLKSNKTKSCGCYQKQRTKEANIKHGDTRTRLFMILQAMKARCYNPNNNRYYRYGARGICICDEWLDKENGYLNFKKWALNNGYSDTLTIDRINVDGNYEPANCKWSTNKEQSNNRSTNRFIEYNGQRKTIAEWSEITGIPQHRIWNRLKANKPLSEVFYKKEEA